MPAATTCVSGYWGTQRRGSKVPQRFPDGIAQVGAAGGKASYTVKVTKTTNQFHKICSCL